VALAYWFGRGNPTVFINFEKNGPLGTQFRAEIERLQYPYVYMDKPRGDRSAKRTRKPGFHTTRTSEALEPLVSGLTNQQIVIRSEELIRECSEYEFGPNGDWTHPGAINAKDPSNAGFNHGDRAVAAGIAVFSLRDRGLMKDFRPKRQKQDPSFASAPRNTMAGRYHRAIQQQRERQSSMSCVW
jgi:hypothetical protein